jgi:predicted acyltransferase
MTTTVLQQNRLVSLDAFRGATIAGMILVNNPGTWNAIYPQLEHSTWNGWTFTDLIFPFFLWIVGVAMTFSLGRRQERGDSKRSLLLQVVRRALIIWGLGLFLSGFPYFNLTTIRILGVLPRIGICYFAASLLILYTKSVRVQVYCLLGLLISYWLMMKLIPVPGVGTGVLERGRNLSAYVDSLVLSGHMWGQTKTWDPEGIVSTLPAIATAIFGVLTGRFLRSEHSKEEKTAWMFVAGNLLILAAAILDMWLPINKSIWTSTYSIFMAGMALICFATFYWLIDVKGYSRWAKPFIVFGMNAIAIYVFSEWFGKLYDSVIVWKQADGSEVSLQEFIFNSIFLPLASPVNASLLFAICYLLFIFSFAWILWKRKWFLRV